MSLGPLAAVRSARSPTRRVKRNRRRRGNRPRRRSAERPAPPTGSAGPGRGGHQLRGADAELRPVARPPHAPGRSARCQAHRPAGWSRPARCRGNNPAITRRNNRQTRTSPVRSAAAPRFPPRRLLREARRAVLRQPRWRRPPSSTCASNSARCAGCAVQPDPRDPKLGHLDVLWPHVARETPSEINRHCRISWVARNGSTKARNSSGASVWTQ